MTTATAAPPNSWTWSGYWHNEQFHYQGTYYRPTAAACAARKKAELPLICTAGSSVAARELAAKHADYYLMRAERPEDIRALIDDVRQRAIAHGNPDPLRPVDRRDHPRQRRASLRRSQALLRRRVAKGVVKARAAHAGLRSARKLSFEHDYGDKDERGLRRLLHPPQRVVRLRLHRPAAGHRLVGSYANVVARIREYHAWASTCSSSPATRTWKRAYRIGEHILPHFRQQRSPPAARQRPATWVPA
jgi:alkanesulfonate monooxygenase